MNAPVKTFLRKLRKLFVSKSFLFLVNGILLASLVYIYSEDNYEKQLFKAIAASIEVGLPASEPARQDSILTRSVTLCHKLLKRRTAIFGSADFKGLTGGLLQPVSFDLMTGKGACGGNTYVLGRILQEFNINMRFLLMKVDGKYGGHILMEAETAGRWKVLDPLYNLSFKRPDGMMASFKDVHRNWDYYKQQVPAGYNMAYNYSDAAYTNWNKIPVIMPMIKQVLYLVKGKSFTDKYSLRTLVLRKYNIAFQVALALYIALCIYMLRLFIRKKKEPTIFIKEEEYKINIKQQPSQPLSTVYN